MLDLAVDAIGVATARAGHQPVAALADDYVLPLARLVAEAGGIPLERIWMLAADGGADLATHALASLGAPAAGEPLFLVRSGPLRDPYVVELARLVHEADWPGEDLGITHLDELGGTVVFDLLDWAVEGGATALICDEPQYTDALADRVPLAAVALRLRRGRGPLRVLGSGEGAPGSGFRGLTFPGSRACDSWIALHAALAAGEIADGEKVLLHTRGPAREGWLAMEAVDVAAVRLARGADAAARTESRVP